MSTGETEQLRETCNARCYQSPTYAPDIDKIIVERYELIPTSENRGIAKITFVMMNPDGTGEEEVVIE